MAINFEDVIGVAQQLIEIDEQFEEKFEEFEKELTQICESLRRNPRPLVMIVWREDQRELYKQEFYDEATFLKEICSCLNEDGFKAIILDAKNNKWGSTSYYPYN